MKKYQIVLADPLWSYNDKKGNDPKLGGITYSVMGLEDIKNLPVNKISDENSALFLWVTMPMLQEGLDVIKAWGFWYRTCAFCWVKLNPKGVIIKQDKDIILKGGIYSGLGHWVNGNAELCLFAKKGHPKRNERNVKQITIYPRGRHSTKPLIIREKIVRLMGDLPRIELFAREKVDGWTSLGYDINGKGIKESLQELARETNE